MRSFSRRLHSFLILTSVLLVALSSRPTGAASAPIVLVVVGQGSTLKDVSKAELRKLFLRNTNKIDGREFVPLNHPTRSDIRLRFDKQVLGMSEAEAGRYWIDRRIRDEPGAPRAVTPPTLLRKVVASMPSAITYMSANDVDSSVRVLTVDGKGPSDPGYPLK